MKNIQELTTPSGTVYQADRLTLIRRLHAVETIIWSERPITLASGIASHVYVRAREELTQHTDVLAQVGLMLSREIYKDALYEKDTRMPCIIGIPTAGSALAAAAALVAKDRPMAFKNMREVQKTHGADAFKWVDGSPEATVYRYCTIENVVASGKSLKEAKQRLNDDRYPVFEMIDYVLVDREQGGVERLCQYGYTVRPLFLLGDIAYALGELGLWHRDQVQAVLDEIKAHQFA